MKSKYLFILAIVAALTIFVSSCGKDAAIVYSIVGNWNISTLRQIQKTNNVVTQDTTVSLPSPNTIFSFESSGSLYRYSSSGVDSGYYTYSGNTLKLKIGSGTPVTTTVDTLTDHLLRFELMDTPSIVPFKTRSVIYNCTR